MKMPQAKLIGGSMVYQDRFSGINRADGTPFGEWQELTGFDLSSAPAISTIGRRGRSYSFAELPADMQPTGYGVRENKIMYTVPDGIFIGENKISLELTEGKKQLVNMGAYVVILPDIITVNIAVEPFEVRYSKDTGTELPGKLKEYNFHSSVYDKSDAEKLLAFEVKKDIGAVNLYKEGDSVVITWELGGKEISRNFTIKRIAETEYTDKDSVWLILDTRQMSDLSFFYILNTPADNTGYAVVTSAKIKRVAVTPCHTLEYNNRLWCCSPDGREIYCSKLGDPFNWGEYKGISTDSFTVTVGSQGEFTGSAVFADKVCFFKENCVHMIYGTKASNFTVSTIALRGVQKGSENSICRSGGLLYYKAPEGIYAFNGVRSYRVDNKLMQDIKETAVGVADDNVLYMLTESGKAYVYDFLQDGWHNEIISGAKAAFEINGRLYAVIKYGNSNYLYNLKGKEDDEADSPGISFTAITGELLRDIPLTKHISGIRMMLEAVPGVNFSVALSYDKGGWETVYSGNGNDSGLLTISLTLRRCSKLQLKISGGAAASNGVMPVLTVYGICLDLKEGSSIV